MKSSLRKLLVLVVVLAMTFSLLTACVVKESGGEKDDSGKTASGTTAPEEARKEPVKIKIMCRETWAGAEFGYATGLPKIKEIEKRTGVEIEWEVYPIEEYSNVAEARLAAAIDLPDTISPVSASYALQKAKEGIFIRIDDLIEKYGPNIKKRYDTEYPDMWNLITQDDGSIYYIQRMHAQDGWDIETLIYRDDWREKIGMSKPPETTDEFYMYLKQCQEQDVNGNGEKDEIFTAEASYRPILALSPTFGVPLYTMNITDGWQEKDGELYFPWITPEAKEMAEYLNRLYKENLLTWTSVSGHEEIARNNALAATSHFPGNAFDIIQSYVKDVEGAKYSILMPLIGPQGHGRDYAYRIPLFPHSDCFVITKDSKHPDAVVRLWDFMISEEGYLLNTYGLEGVHWERNEEGLIAYTKQWEETLEKDPDAWRKFGILYCFPVWTNLGIEQVTVNWPKDARDTILEIFKLPRLNRQMPGLAVATEEEQDILDLYLPELKDYSWGTFLKFISGEEPLSNWDDYVKRIYDLGLEKIKSIEQARYDRLFKK